MMAARRRATALALGFLIAPAVLAGCGQHDRLPFGTDTQTSGPAVGEVLKVIDGVEIGVEELRQLQAAGRLGVVEALAVLETEALLMAEAERRGYGTRPEVRWVERQAMAQAYVEALAAEAQVSPEQLAQAYERGKERFQQSERRAFVHALAPLPRDRAPTAEEEAAAAELVRQAQRSMSAPGADPVKVLRALDGQALRYAPVKVEDVPGMSSTELVQPFAQALFAAPAPGPLGAPVRTLFGWHAVVLTEILPARQVPLEQAEAELRAELLTKARADALTKQVESLRGAWNPEWVAEHRERLDSLSFDE